MLDKSPGFTDPEPQILDKSLGFSGAEPQILDKSRGSSDPEAQILDKSLGLASPQATNVYKHLPAYIYRLCGPSHYKYFLNSIRALFNSNCIYAVT